MAAQALLLNPCCCCCCCCCCCLLQPLFCMSMCQQHDLELTFASGCGAIVLLCCCAMAGAAGDDTARLSWAGSDGAAVACRRPRAGQFTDGVDATRDRTQVRTARNFQVPGCHDLRLDGPPRQAQDKSRGKLPPPNLSFMQGADGAFEADASPGARGWLAAR